MYAPIIDFDWAASSQDVERVVSSALWNLRFFYAPHDVTFDSPLVVDSKKGKTLLR